MDNAYLFGKVYFPRLIVPMSNTLLCIVRGLLQFVVLAIVFFVYMIRGEVSFMGPRILWLIPLFLLSTIMGTALGMIISALTVKYRDFDHITGMAMTVLMYISPVLYPTSQLSPLIKRFVYINPMSSLVEAFRYILMGTGEINVYGMIYSIVATILLALLAIILYGQAEKDFIDIV